MGTGIKKIGKRNQIWRYIRNEKGWVHGSKRQNIESRGGNMNEMGEIRSQRGGNKNQWGGNRNQRDGIRNRRGVIWIKWVVPGMK